MENEIKTLEKIINSTIIYIKNYLNNNIITTTLYNKSIQKLENIFLDILNKDISIIKEELSSILELCGTQNISDILYLNNFDFDTKFLNKFNILSKYFHPINFKFFNYNKKNKNKEKLSKLTINDNDKITIKSKNFECFNLSRSSKNYFIQIYGIKLFMFNKKQNKCIIIEGIMDDVLISCFKNEFVNKKHKNLKKKKKSIIYSNFLNILTLKDLLIYSKLELEKIFKKYKYLNDEIKKNTIETNVITFVNNNLYNKRNTLISLLIETNNNEMQYLAYLLYDLLSNEKEKNDNNEQIQMFNTLPWNLKKLFYKAMKNTLEYTKKISMFNQSNIPEEQRICLLKTSDFVKKKAMDKLNEIKSKSEDSACKPKKYLNGLLQIPFKIFKKEKILENITDINTHFKTIINIIKNNNLNIQIVEKNKYNILEIKKYINIINKKILNNINNILFDNFINFIFNKNKKEIISIIKNINIILKLHNHKKIITSNININKLKKNIINGIKPLKNNLLIFNEIYNFNNDFNYKIKINIKSINKKIKEIKNYLNSIDTTLDNSIYGHNNAKKQIKKIIGEWINGEQNGYSFGFEGPPGVGKTSLAIDGICNCLKDENGNKRPFSFIAIGGTSNGSTIQGHNYTYVGSTWGKIVDILIESKCMNPIIFIDELDKVSNSENGKDIIGILTHLTDSTQNYKFQDKYFSGIDLDLSKALFIFSYNDPNKIDKILLDRIHRIKFKPLTLKEKIVISNKYIIPKILNNIGLYDSINISDEIISYIITTFTNEPGVRKLKQLLLDIIRDINLEILNSDKLYDKEYPIVVKKNDIVNKYLKNKQNNIFTKIHKTNSVGIISGLWANSMGNGGIISIQASFFYSSTFLDFKLTGMQGDVMKESMEVAKTLALKKTNLKKDKFQNKFKEKLQGIHIHCSDASTPKDGPSAGAAITTVIYSLLHNKKIKNNIAITGEINIQGEITAIGGLELKIIGGVRAGVKHFLFPKENNNDFNKFINKFNNDEIYKNIKFTSVSNINEILKLVFI